MSPLLALSVEIKACDEARGSAVPLQWQRAAARQCSSAVASQSRRLGLGSCRQSGSRRRFPGRRAPRAKMSLKRSAFWILPSLKPTPEDPEQGMSAEQQPMNSVAAATAAFHPGGKRKQLPDNDSAPHQPSRLPKSIAATKVIEIFNSDHKRISVVAVRADMSAAEFWGQVHRSQHLQYFCILPMC
jgi:hypothetical protein